MALWEFLRVTFKRIHGYDQWRLLQWTHEDLLVLNMVLVAIQSYEL